MAREGRGGREKERASRGADETVGGREGHEEPTKQSRAVRGKEKRDRRRVLREGQEREEEGRKEEESRAVEGGGRGGRRARSKRKDSKQKWVSREEGRNGEAGTHCKSTCGRESKRGQKETRKNRADDWESFAVCDFHRVFF